MSLIAVVDDDVTFCEAVGGLLEQQGYKVVVANDAPEFIATAQRSYFDLVVLDMQMPGGGGPAVMQFLAGAEEHAAVPLLFVTSMPIEHVKGWYKGTARTCFMQKPPNLIDFVENIKRLLNPAPPH